MAKGRWPEQYGMADGKWQMTDGEEMAIAPRLPFAIAHLPCR